MRYFLAIDLGASSGRHVLGWLADGVLHTEVIHNFKNEIIHIDGTMCWDIDYLFVEIVSGIKKCGSIGKIPETIAIDSFGVDFVLLDADGKRIGSAVSYRDGRTTGMEQIAFETITEAQMYQRTGTISHNFNTIYQLLALQRQSPGLLDRAHSLLMIPEYLNYMLTGVKMSEYTNATTTGLLNSQIKDWDDAIIDAFGLPRRIFGDIYKPGDVVGELSASTNIGFPTKVVLSTSHDTASAVVATPFVNEKTGSSLFLSSDTWSLLGAEINASISTENARSMGFSNEGGYGGTIRFLKNIMGMWMLQSVKRELDDKHSFPDLDAMAQTAQIDSIVDCADGRFFAPTSMMAEIAAACAESGQQVPCTPGEYARIIYKSLAVCYHKAIAEMEALFGKEFTHLHIIGGGSQSKFLNTLTAEATGKEVVAGPVEATAIGNIAVQMIAAGVFSDLASARNCIRRSSS